MTPQQSPLPRVHQPVGGLLLSCAALTLLLLLAAVPVAAWNNQQYGTLGVVAAAVALLICLSGAMAALVLTARLANTPAALSANLGAMFVRMGVPLAGLLLLPNLLPDLAAVGLSHSILILYLVGLVVETLLALRHVVPTADPARRLPNAGSTISSDS